MCVCVFFFSSHIRRMVKTAAGHLITMANSMILLLLWVATAQFYIMPLASKDERYITTKEGDK